jgi:hypothetical protein
LTVPREFDIKPRVPSWGKFTLAKTHYTCSPNKLAPLLSVIREVEDFMRQCAVCHQVKHSNTKPVGLLQPLPIPSDIWHELTMDFMEGLPLSLGANVIMVVDVYERLYSCRQCWASKCRGL